MCGFVGEIEALLNRLQSVAMQADFKTFEYA